MSSDEDYVYGEVSGEWRPASQLAAEAAAEAMVRDAEGNELSDGDSVTLTKDLKVKGDKPDLEAGHGHQVYTFDRRT